MTPDAIDKAITRLNDTYGVANWVVANGVLHVTLDDGDTVTIYPDGTEENSWETE
jgi:hypothetical protein